MNTTVAFALARLLAAVVVMVAALGAVAQDDEGRARPSSRERRLGIPGAQAPGGTPPVFTTPPQGASVPGAVPTPVPGAGSAPAPGAPFAVPGPAPVPLPPPAQPVVPPADTTAFPAPPAVVPPPRQLPPPADPARSDAPSGWPKVVVAGGIYSPNRAHRVVIINGAPAREGAEPVPGVVVEQVRANGVVLSYRGQRHTVMY